MTVLTKPSSKIRQQVASSSHSGPLVKQDAHTGPSLCRRLPLLGSAAHSWWSGQRGTSRQERWQGQSASFVTRVHAHTTLFSKYKPTRLRCALQQPWNATFKSRRNRRMAGYLLPSSGTTEGLASSRASRDQQQNARDHAEHA